MNTIENLHEGLTKKRVIFISRDDIVEFGERTGDSNPLHFDDEFGRITQFGQINAHGMLLASHIVALVGAELPGPGWMCLGVDSTFNNPVFPDEELEVQVSVRKLVPVLNVAVLEGHITNAAGVAVCRSQIKVKQLEMNGEWS